MVNLKEECPFPGLSSHGSGHHGDDNVCLNQHCGVCECDKEEIKHYSWLIDSQEKDQKEEEEMVEDCERDNQPSSSSSNKDNDEMEDEMVDVISEDEMKSSSSFLFNSQLFQPW